MTISTKEDVTLPGLGRSGPHPEARPWGELVGEGLVNARVPGCVNLPVLLPERLVVTGADEPVYAQAGEDVTLSCSVNTTVNVTELQVEWKKTEDGIMVLQYNKGKIPERYSGRAEFYIEEIPKGNFSMKLRKVRFEDKGEFKCDVHSDTDSKSTTAWIAAVGYSSWHWGILVLCFAVIPVVILTVALLARNYIKEIESRQDECRRLCLEGPYEQWSELHRKLHRELRRERCCQCLLVAVPAGIVCIAFILWGVTEGEPIKYG
nr:myelin-oligodendrocyte glycoprotein-like [Paramormyrops kingsleyae]